MGLLDSLRGGILGEIETAALPALISAALAKTNLGNLQGLVSQLQQAGLNKQVQSWLGNGPNMGITAEQLRAGLETNRCVNSLSILGSTRMQR